MGDKRNDNRHQAFINRCRSALEELEVESKCESRERKKEIFRVRDKISYLTETNANENVDLIRESYSTLFMMEPGTTRDARLLDFD
jgi:hypothetical protein